MIVEEISSESHGAAEPCILLTLHKKVHVLLAKINLVRTLLKAVQEGLVEAVARVLLNLLVIGGLSILFNWSLLHGGLLHRSLLLLLLTVA